MTIYKKCYLPEYKIVLLEMPYNDCTISLDIAGKTFGVSLLGTDYHTAQLYVTRECIPFLFPLLPETVGLFKDGVGRRYYYEKAI